MVFFFKFISIVLHPLLMCTYFFLLLMYGLPAILLPARPSRWIILLIFVTTFALPAANFLFLRLTGSISSLTLPQRRQRLLPFVFISAVYVFVTVMFYWKFPIPNLLKLMAIITTLTISATVITFFYKISVHSLSIWGAIGMLLPLNRMSEENLLLVPTAIAILLAGLVMTSRLALNAHTPNEVMVGGVVGFACGFFGMVLFF